ncbi:hypothetical protein LMG27198_41780 [Methylocystis echinoides]|uniref:Uncharacterized protein n=1 Tax=Methylocystis echinoides TaxID=29468 RepID=A0A9W6GY06_9HYPH|nr:hypothetical protein LMG27198_41780 [Methylocystis echinoides]
MKVAEAPCADWRPFPRISSCKKPSPKKRFPAPLRGSFSSTARVSELADPNPGLGLRSPESFPINPGGNERRTGGRGGGLRQMIHCYGLTGPKRRVLIA